MKAKQKINVADSNNFFMPALEAMVRDGVFPDVDAAKSHLIKLENKYYAKLKSKPR